MTTHRSRTQMSSNNLSRGMSHASRASTRAKDYVPVDSKPLTPEEFKAIRLAEESIERQRIKGLNDAWNEHEAVVRRGGR